MKKNLVIIFLLILTKIYSQSDVGYVFGVKIAPTWNGVVTYFETFYNGHSFSETTVLSKDDFVLRTCGYEYSPANPDTVNLYVKYKIEQGPVVKYTYQPVIMSYGILDSLWKLRFAVYPYQVNSPDTIGWTNNFSNPYVPTHKQKQILAQLGMDTVQYIIFGDNFFNLLRVMQDKNWVNHYKNAK